MENKDTRTFEINPKIEMKKVRFTNRYGITLVGDLYLPENYEEKKNPAVIVAGPFGAVKEQASGLYAQELAARGFASIAFDPSFGGESGGEVRNTASPDIFTEDYSAAVDYIGLLPYVDRERIGAAGGDQVFGNHLFEEELKPVFEKAMECGLNLWDTAAVYGEGTSERILGNFVKDVRRNSVILSTKFTPQIAGSSPDAMQEMIDGSKERLHTDVIDVYWIHNPMDIEKWTPDLIPLAKSGQIKTIGVSNHNLMEIKRANEILAAEGLKISAVQNHYSLLHRSSERAGILDYCKENGITFYSYMVLEQGALTGRYSEENPFPEGSGRAEAYNPHLKELTALIDELKIIGTRFDASPAQVATAWAIAKGTLPIIGVTKVRQVEEAAKAAQIELTADEISRLERLGDETGVHTLREWEKEM